MHQLKTVAAAIISHAKHYLQYLRIYSLRYDITSVTDLQFLQLIMCHPL